MNIFRLTAEYILILRHVNVNYSSKLLLSPKPLI